MKSIATVSVTTNLPEYAPLPLGQKERSFEIPDGYHVYVESLGHSDHFDNFSNDSKYVASVKSIMAIKEPACIGIRQIGNPRWGDIAIWLPGVDDQTLDDFANRVPDLENYLSADYMFSTTMLVWLAANGTELRVNEEVLHMTNWPGHRYSLGYGVAFLNETSVRYAAHHLSPSASEEFGWALQASSYCSVNYKPRRVWEPEVLEARKGLKDEAKPGIFIPKMCESPKIWSDDI